MSNNSIFDNLMEQKEEVLQQLEEISKGEKRKIRSMMMISKKLSTHGTSQQLIYIIKPERIQRRNEKKKGEHLQVTAMAIAQATMEDSVGGRKCWLE